VEEALTITLWIVPDLCSSLAGLPVFCQLQPQHQLMAEASAAWSLLFEVVEPGEQSAKL